MANTEMLGGDDGQAEDCLMLESVKKRILAVESKIATIHQMVASERKNDAKQLFRELKEGLQAQYKAMGTAKGEERLSAADRDFYHGFIVDAWANSGISGVRWDSDPKKWNDTLYSVSDYVRHWTDSVNRAMSRANE